MRTIDNIDDVREIISHAKDKLKDFDKNNIDALKEIENENVLLFTFMAWDNSGKIYLKLFIEWYVQTNALADCIVQNKKHFLRGTINYEEVVAIIKNAN